MGTIRELRKLFGNRDGGAEQSIENSTVRVTELLCVLVWFFAGMLLVLVGFLICF